MLLHVHGVVEELAFLLQQKVLGDAVKEALQHCYAEIAAMNPQYISRNDMSAEELTKLREIIEERVR